MTDEQIRVARCKSYLRHRWAGLLTCLRCGAVRRYATPVLYPATRRQRRTIGKWTEAAKGE